MFFYFSFFAFVVLGLVSSGLRQEIGWEESLRNDLFCVEWAVMESGHFSETGTFAKTCVKKRVEPSQLGLD